MKDAKRKLDEVWEQGGSVRITRPKIFPDEYCRLHPADCPYGEQGDKLWVRETFAFTDNCEGYVFYKADSPQCDISNFKWRPSIHMPRSAARIFLDVKRIRVGQLQDISNEDAEKEGAGIEWLRKWIEENYREPDESPYWIHDHFHDYDQSLSFCEKCGKKEVRKMKRLAKKEGATGNDIDEIYLDGGWDTESDSQPYCENCEKPLSYTPLNSFLENRIEDYIQDGFYKSDAYALDQFNDDVLKNIKSFNKICFRTLWDSINAKSGYSWKSNPWVWVVDFEKSEESKCIQEHTY